MPVGHKGRQYIRALENSVPRKQVGARRELIHSFIKFLDSRRASGLVYDQAKRKIYTASAIFKAVVLMTGQ